MSGDSGDSRRALQGESGDSRRAQPERGAIQVVLADNGGGGPVTSFLRQRHGRIREWATRWSPPRRRPLVGEEGLALHGISPQCEESLVEVLLAEGSDDESP